MAAILEACSPGFVFILLVLLLLYLKLKSEMPINSKPAFLLPRHDVSIVDQFSHSPQKRFTVSSFTKETP